MCSSTSKEGFWEWVLTLTTGEPAVFRRFTIERHKLLGEGGFGKTYRAYDRTGKLPGFLAAKGIASTKPSHLKKHQAEADMLKKATHEHVCAIYGSGRRFSEFFMFLELCSGGEARLHPLCSLFNT